SRRTAWWRSSGRGVPRGRPRARTWAQSVPKHPGYHAAMVKVELEEIAVSGDENQFLALLRSRAGETFPPAVDVMRAIDCAAGRATGRLVRRLTPAQFVSLLELLGVEVARVEVTDLVDGTYYAMLVLERGGVRVDVDARPSD